MSQHQVSLKRLDLDLSYASRSMVANATRTMIHLKPFLFVHAALSHAWCIP